MAQGSRRFSWLDRWTSRARTFLTKSDPPPSRDGRHIPVAAASSRARPLRDERTGKPYCANTVHSSRYTLWDFLPRQLWFQFSKLANLYLLVIAGLHFIPGLSPTSNYTAIIPLLVMVSITMAKEGYDDFRRYRLDRAEDTTTTRRLRPLPGAAGAGERASTWRWWRRERSMGLPWWGRRRGDIPQDVNSPWETLYWKDVRVGDIIQLQRDEAVPADMVLLNAEAPDDDNLAHVETASLDGEANLKPKQPCALLSLACSSVEAMRAGTSIVVVAEDPSTDLYTFNGRIEEVTTDLRTSSSSSSSSSSSTPLSMSGVLLRGSVLRNTTRATGLVVATGEQCRIRQNALRAVRTKAPELQRAVNRVVVCVVLFVAGLVAACTAAYEAGFVPAIESRTWYLVGTHYVLAWSATAHALLLNTFIPLAMYSSLEIVKIGQLWQQNQDVDMYDAASDTRMHCNTSTILEDLGQVQYVFSDKTGTLTENRMRFRALSVGGWAWVHRGEEKTEPGEGELGARDAGEGRQKGAMRASYSMPESTMETVLEKASSSESLSDLETHALILQMIERPDSAYARKTKMLLIAMAVCHTCLPEKHADGPTTFQSASPDEVALVRAAAELLTLDIDRKARSVSIALPGQGDDAVVETYTVVEVIEFSPARKRMSVVVRFPDGRLCLVCKGADSAMVPLLASKARGDAASAAPPAQAGTVVASQAADSWDDLLDSDSSDEEMDLPGARAIRLRPLPAAREYGLPESDTEQDHLLKRHDSMDTLVISDADALSRTDSLVSNPLPDERERPAMRRNSSATTLVGDANAGASINACDSSLKPFQVDLDDHQVHARCLKHLDDFATQGLRTLLYGHRFLDEQEFEEWQALHAKASTALSDRATLVEEAGALIERDLHLTGATAVEDKLQPGCVETIEKLRRAGIKVWMLTGDKLETAINIGHSAGICKPESEVIVLGEAATKLHAVLGRALADLQSRRFKHAVVVLDGHTLAQIDTSDDLAKTFFDLIILADSVICCRASPSQKASLVRRTRQNLKRTHAVTLAIGDGANDIPMLLEAHVGIGISGQEGLQAARVADFSLARFRFLAKLLLVHGHWNYARSARYMLLTFWKEACFFTMQAHYQTVCGYTSMSLFDSPALTVFNTLFSSLCVIVFGIWEQDLPPATLLAVPELYRYGQRGQAFGVVKFLGWFGMGLFESAVMFWGMYFLYGRVHGTVDNGVYAMGDMVLGVAIILINTKTLILETHHITLISGVSYAITVAGWFAFNAFLSTTSSADASRTYNLRRSFLDHFGRSPEWWACFALLLAGVLALELAVLVARKALWPNIVEVWQQRRQQQQQQQRASRLRGVEAVEAGSKEMQREVEAVEAEQQEQDAEEVQVKLWRYDGPEEGYWRVTKAVRRARRAERKVEKARKRAEKQAAKRRANGEECNPLHDDATAAVGTGTGTAWQRLCAGTLRRRGQEAGGAM